MAGLTEQRLRTVPFDLNEVNSTNFYSGTASGLKRTLRVTASSGALALTGPAAALSTSRRLAAAFGSTTFSGTAAQFRRALRLVRRNPLTLHPRERQQVYRLSTVFHIVST